MNLNVIGAFYSSNPLTLNKVMVAGITGGASDPVLGLASPRAIRGKRSRLGRLSVRPRQLLPAFIVLLLSLKIAAMPATQTEFSVSPEQRTRLQRIGEANKEPIVEPAPIQCGTPADPAPAEVSSTPPTSDTDGPDFFLPGMPYPGPHRPL
jgi:hypothetical protein